MTILEFTGKKKSEKYTTIRVKTSDIDKIKKAYQKCWQIASKNKDISKSVSSIDAGAIFLSRSGQDLSRYAFVARIVFPERISLGGTGFCMTPKI